MRLDDCNHTLKEPVRCYSFQHLRITHVLSFCCRLASVPNAAPADGFLFNKYRFIKHLLINEPGAAIFSGIDPRRLDDMAIKDWVDIAETFGFKGVENTVITLGAAGAVFAEDRGAGRHVAAFKTEVVDPTGAG